MLLPISRKILFALFSFILTLCLSIVVAHSSGQSKVVEELSFTAPTAPEWNSGLAVQSLLKQTEEPDLVPSVDFVQLARDFQSRVGDHRSEKTVSTVQPSSKPPSSTSSLLQQGLQLYQSDRFTESIQLYQQAIAASAQNQDALTEALAQRYLALAYQELGQWQPAKAAIEQSLKLLKTLPARDSTYFEVLAKVLNTQGRHQFQTGQVEAALETWKQATLNYQKAGQQDGVVSTLINQAKAYQQAKTLQDPRTESYALGQLGALYESNQQWSDAKKLTIQALLRLEGLQASDLRYRWEWQLGRLLKQQGDLDPAIKAYTRAITALQSVRENLLLINPDVQFSFRDRVEPIYRDLTALLLQSNATTAPTQTQLQSAIANIDSLQLAELENFLRCDLSQLASASQDLDPHAAFIYPIILSDRIEVIVRFPGQSLSHYTTKVKQGTVEQTLQALRQAILRSNASRVIEYGKQVYTWLMEPLESDLAKNRAIETSVFVLDGDLRSVPMPVLYDAKTDQYLVEKPYAIALLPTSQLFDLKTLPQAGKVLGAGISEPLQVENRRFDALNAKAELSQVQTTTRPEILLNSEFTHTKLQEKLRSQQGFSIVHLVTHGNFSSDPEETYLLLHSPVAAKGELLKPNDLALLLRPTGLTSNQLIDLLVLSACKTAEGDNRATLGLVGLAVRAGARSTLGTLWQVSDDSTIALMNQFYDELKQPGVSKAKALHRAQISLLQNTKYQNPYHWAPYILVGNWL
jgi:CHAT domain-containing protein